MLKYVSAVLLVGVAITPAAAQERAPFTGPRVEALAGYDVLRSGEAEDGIETGENEGDESIDGVGYGIGVGYDIAAGRAVFGIEGEVSGSTAEQEMGETVDGTEYLGRIATGRDLYVGGRVGFAVAPRTLAYVKAGYTNLAVESTVTSGTTNVDFDTNVDGYRLGAGVEQQLGGNTFVKAEYRYSNYGNLSFNDARLGANDVDIDLDRHQVMAGVGIRF